MKGPITQEELELYVKDSVLCWLATSSADNMPNVSPKEVFNLYDSNTIIIACVASPGSIRNIKENANVCLSFIDILRQKGLQIHGSAEIVTKTDRRFSPMESILLRITEGKIPFAEIIAIDIAKKKRIIAPRYWLYPETTEEEQIASALKVYKLDQ